MFQYPSHAGEHAAQVSIENVTPHRLSVQADPVSRSYEVKVLVANAGHRILPGMICEAWLENAAMTNAIQLPANLIQIDSDNKPFVWTVVGNKAHRVDVTLGENVGENVAILGGLSPEQVVITEGQQKVSEGMVVKSEK